MSAKNLAAFTKQRPGKTGPQHMNTTSQAGSKATKSIFTQNSRMTSKRGQETDVRSSASFRVRKTSNNVDHKRRIMDVVNNLNEDELEKVSEMLRVSEALE